MDVCDTQPVQILLSDWQTTNGNIFTYLIDTVQAPYLTGVDADMMDFLLTSMFGQRQVRISFQTQTSDFMATFLNKLYGNRWQKEYDLFNQMTGLAGDAVVTNTNTNSQTGKVAGFDSDTMVDTNGSDATGSSSNTTITIQGLMTKDQAVRARKFQEQICEDIARFMTLSIY